MSRHRRRSETLRHTDCGSPSQLELNQTPTQITYFLPHHSQLAPSPRRSAVNSGCALHLFPAARRRCPAGLLPSPARLLHSPPSPQPCRPTRPSPSCTSSRQVRWPVYPRSWSCTRSTWSRLACKFKERRPFPAWITTLAWSTASARLSRTRGESCYEGKSEDRSTILIYIDQLLPSVPWYYRPHPHGSAQACDKVRGQR